MSASSSSSSASVPSIKFDDMHPKDKVAQQPQGSGSALGFGAHHNPLGPKGFLLKKIGAGQSFCSPTDTMVSPCTAKLVQSKQRHYTKGKPLSLSSSFQASTNNITSSPTGTAPAPSAFKPKPLATPSGLGRESSFTYGTTAEKENVEDEEMAL